MAGVLSFFVESAVLSDVDSVKAFLDVVRAVVSSVKPDLVYVVGGRRAAGFIENVCRSEMVASEVVLFRVRSDDDVIFVLRESGLAVFIIPSSCRSGVIHTGLFYAAVHCPQMFLYIVYNGKIVSYRLERHTVT